MGSGCFGAKTNPNSEEIKKIVSNIERLYPDKIEFIKGEKEENKDIKVA